MAEEDSEKTEQATDARREEFRKRGQVAHTRELGSSLVLIGGAGTILLLSSYFMTQINEIFQYSFGEQLVQHIREGHFVEALRFTMGKALMLILPVTFIGAIISVASTLMQIGFLNVEDAISFDFNTLNPVDGFKRIFSLRGIVEGAKSLLKFVLIFCVVYMVLKSELKIFPRVINFSVTEILSYLGVISAKLLFAIGLVMMGLSLADYLFQRWDLEKKMMMTKQEIKEEMRQREGDPLIKARIRRVQKDMANKRMMEAIPKGDVVITNPTHIAVVLKYDKNLPAPQLIAKGADLVAEKIRNIAREHKIPIVENKPLARTIFKTMKLGQVIPRELFVAVAEVLSYVYKLKRKVKS